MTWVVEIESAECDEVRDLPWRFFAGLVSLGYRWMINTERWCIQVESSAICPMAALQESLKSITSSMAAYGISGVAIMQLSVIDSDCYGASSDVVPDKYQ